VAPRIQPVDSPHPLALPDKHVQLSRPDRRMPQQTLRCCEVRPGINEMRCVPMPQPVRGAPWYPGAAHRLTDDARDGPTEDRCCGPVAVPDVRGEPPPGAWHLRGGRDEQRMQRDRRGDATLPDNM